VIMPASASRAGRRPEDPPRGAGQGRGSAGHEALLRGVIEDAGLALRYVRPPRMSFPSRARRRRKARENWKIYAEGRSLSEADQTRIQQLRQQLDKQFCRRCDYCQPCSQGINIQLMMGIKSVIRRFGNPDEVAWVRAWRRRPGTARNAGLPAPLSLPAAIPDLIKKNLEWYDNLKNNHQLSAVSVQLILFHFIY